MTYVDGMNYAKDRLEASQTKAFRKRKKVRPPTLCTQDELGGDNANSVSDGATFVASSRRSSSAYRAVEETAAAKTIMLEAEAEAKRALARLADARTECSE